MLLRPVQRKFLENYRNELKSFKMCFFLVLQKQILFFIAHFLRKIEQLESD